MHAPDRSATRPPLRPTDPALGYAQVALAAVLWGSLGVAGRIAFAGGATPFAAAAWRALLAFAALLLLTLARERAALRLERRDAPLFLVWGTLGVAVFFVVYMEAVALTTVATAAILLYTAPAFIALAGPWLGERGSRRKAGAIALAFLGVALVARGYDPAAVRLNAPGLLAGLGAGLGYALYSVCAKVAVRRYPPTMGLTYALGIGSALLMGAGLLTGRVGFAYTASAWAAIAYLGLVTVALASSLFASGLRHVEATRASVVATIEPVVAAALAFAVLGEGLEPAQVLGGALVVAAALWVQRG